MTARLPPAAMRPAWGIRFGIEIAHLIHPAGAAAGEPLRQQHRQPDGAGDLGKGFGHEPEGRHSGEGRSSAEWSVAAGGFC
jgi:hypothetical protein